jgi:hypothetical protein
LQYVNRLKKSSATFAMAVFPFGMGMTHLGHAMERSAKELERDMVEAQAKAEARCRDRGYWEKEGNNVGVPCRESKLWENFIRKK